MERPRPFLFVFKVFFIETGFVATFPFFADPFGLPRPLFATVSPSLPDSFGFGDGALARFFGVLFYKCGFS